MIRICKQHGHWRVKYDFDSRSDDIKTGDIHPLHPSDHCQPKGRQLSHTDRISAFKSDVLQVSLHQAITIARVSSPCMQLWRIKDGKTQIKYCDSDNYYCTAVKCCHSCLTPFLKTHFWCWAVGHLDSHGTDFWNKTIRIQKTCRRTVLLNISIEVV